MNCLPVPLKFAKFDLIIWQISIVPLKSMVIIEEF